MIERSSPGKGCHPSFGSRSKEKARRILVVDDDPTIVDLYPEVLRGMGHRVDTATNGMEGFRKVQENDYDLIITDLRMPEMNGICLYHEICKLKPHMRNRIIFSTGDLTYANFYGFMSLSEASCLVKPVGIQKLQKAVEKVLFE